MGQKLTSVQLLMIQNQTLALAALTSILKSGGAKSEAIDAINKQMDLNVKILAEGEIK